MLDPEKEGPGEGVLAELTDDAYFEHLNAAKAEGVVGMDEDGNEYPIDAGVVDARGAK